MKDQFETCRRFEAEPTVPAETEKLGIALATLDQLPLNAIRYLPVNGTCGWYIWGGESSEAEDFFQALHVAHIGEYCPSLVPYLALPPGYGVILAPDYEGVWFDPAFVQP